MDHRKIDDIFKLSLTQRAFLFQSLSAKWRDAGVLQLHVGLRGKLDATELDTAWQVVANRYSALRSSVHWEDLSQPIQVVHREVVVPVQDHELRHLKTEEQQDHLASLISADRHTNFDLTQAPVMRVNLIHLSQDRKVMVWTCHHMLLDGWSAAIVLRQVLEQMTNAGKESSQQRPAVCRYRNYIAWLQQQDREPARRFWQQHLSDLPSENEMFLPVMREPEWRDAYEEFDVAQSVALNDCAGKLKVTLGSIIQSAWALALRSRQTDHTVVFGVTDSGRGIPLAGVESLVGMFMNALPVCVRFSPSMNLDDVALQIHELSRQRQDYQFVNPGEIQSWNCCPGWGRLFDSLVVFANYPWDVESLSDDLKVISFEGDITTAHPLTLIVIPGERLSLRLRYATESVSDHQATILLGQIKQILEAFASGRSQKIVALPESSPWVAKQTDGEITLSSTHDDQPAPPRTTLEKNICRIWREVLKCPDIGLNAPFLEVGGTSLLGLIVLDRIKSEVGVSLPLVALFQAPTVAQLCALIDQQRDEPEWKWLTSVMPGSTRMPIILVNCGNIMVWAMGDHLDPRHPVYVLHGHWDQANIDLSATIEDIADTYIKEIRQAQPHGPYILGGYSVGALIAYEIAQRLRDQGERIALLFLLDPPVHPSVSSEPVVGNVSSEPLSERRRLGAKWVNYKQTIVQAGWHGCWRYVKRRLDTFKERLLGKVKFPLACVYRWCGRPIPPSFRGSYVFRAYKNAFRRYQFQPYEGSMLIFRIGKGTSRVEDGWEKLAKGPVKVHQFDVDHHFDFLRDPIVTRQWTELFAQYVDMTEKDTPRSADQTT